MKVFKNFTEEEVEYIKQNYEYNTLKDIAEHLGKKPNSVYNVINKLGIKKQVHKPWTQEEIDYLKQYYIEQTSEEIAKNLGRSVVSVNAERDRLNLVRHPSWTQEEVEFLINNYENMNHEDIGRVIGKTRGAVTAKCFDLNLYKKERPWEDWELDFVKNNYMEMSKAEISEVLNRSCDAIQVKANRMGLKKSPYFCNYHYFDTIDTEDKAYWLGFLTADGWISKSEKTGSGVTGIELQYGDIGHLKKFNKSIQGNYQITDRWRTCNLSKKDKDKKNHTCVIRIFSLLMYNSLCKLGFSNNKSYDFHIPEMSENLIRHYIRGYFDGDGRLCFTNKSFGVSFITASYSLCEDLLKILNQISIKVNNYVFVNEFGTTMYSPEIHRLADKIKFLDWIYEDCNIYLDRKYKKYLKIKNKYEQGDSLAV